MALTATVTKKSVTQTMDKLWSIALNLSVTDGAVEVLNQDFSLKYRPGQDVAEKVKAVRDEMQKTIDDYKGEQQLLNHAHLDTAVTWLNNNIVG